MPAPMPTTPDADPFARVRDSFDRQAFMRTLDARLTQVGAGRCEAVMPIQPAFGQQHGFLHGAVVTALSDSAAGHAALSLMPPGASVLAIEYKQNFFAPATGDRLIARAEVVRAGKTVSVVTAHAFTVTNGVEKPVALLVATMMTMRDAA